MNWYTSQTTTPTERMTLLKFAHETLLRFLTQLDVLTYTLTFLASIPTQFLPFVTQAGTRTLAPYLIRGMNGKFYSVVYVVLVSLISLTHGAPSDDHLGPIPQLLQHVFAFFSYVVLPVFLTACQTAEISTFALWPIVTPTWGVWVMEVFSEYVASKGSWSDEKTHVTTVTVKPTNNNATKTTVDRVAVRMTRDNPSRFVQRKGISWMFLAALLGVVLAIKGMVAIDEKYWAMQQM